MRAHIGRAPGRKPTSSMHLVTTGGAIRRRNTLRRGPAHARGQALAEFALILLPMMLIILGIIQMGFIFNAYVTVANAAREGAREASIYVYDHNQSRGQNDSVRAARARSAVKSTMGLLSSSPPQLSDSDIVITYPACATCPPATDARKGWPVSVDVRYHLDLLIPLIGNLMPQDANGRMPINGQVTMVVN